MRLELPEDRVSVKICGITNEQDALGAIESGVHLLGFNTWKGSKRFLDLAKHESWIAKLPVIRVALTVNAPLEEASALARAEYIDAIQVHGDEDAGYCRALAACGKPVIKAIRVKERSDFLGADGYSTSHILLDAHVPGAFGGTGVRVNLNLANEFKAAFPGIHLWLAGGLVAENVSEAVRAVRPRVVDVSSGVEASPGVKDLDRMKAFCAAARV